MKRLDPASADLRILQDSDLSILPAEVAGRAVPQVLAVPTATTRAGAVRPEVRPRTVQAQGRGHTTPAIKRREINPELNFSVFRIAICKSQYYGFTLRYANLRYCRMRVQSTQPSAQKVGWKPCGEAAEW
jgi:hypothetical protein